MAKSDKKKRKRVSTPLSSKRNSKQKIEVTLDGHQLLEKNFPDSLHQSEKLLEWMIHPVTLDVCCRFFIFVLSDGY
jgi:hypothetical protein